MSAIELHARCTKEYAARAAHALAELQAAAAAHTGRIVQATSLGVEDMVITDLIARHQLPIAIGTLQTGLLHAETLAATAAKELAVNNIGHVIVETLQALPLEAFETNWVGGAPIIVDPTSNRTRGALRVKAPA